MYTYQRNNGWYWGSSFSNRLQPSSAKDAEMLSAASITVGKLGGARCCDESSRSRPVLSVFIVLNAPAHAATFEPVDISRGSRYQAEANYHLKVARDRIHILGGGERISTDTNREIFVFSLEAA
jgi:hypothetical protein